MNILHLELFPGEHTGLEDNSHVFTCYETIFKIQLLGDIFVYKIIEIILLIDFKNSTDGTDTRRINLCTIQAIFLSGSKLFIRTHNTGAVRICFIGTPFIY